MAVGACLAAQPAAGDIIWGVNGHPVTAYPGVSPEDQLDLVKDLGMTSYRVNISFPDQAAILAPVVDAAKARGVAVLPVLTPGEIDLESDSPSVLYGKAYDFAFGLGSRFKDDIRVWELGNEMEIFAIIRPCELLDDGTVYPCEWGPAGGTGKLDYSGSRWQKVSAVLRGLSDAIHAVDPDLQRAIGTAGWGHVGAFERMREDGIPWDISVWHMYGQDPEWAFKILDDYDRPIWITEFNHPYGSLDGVAAQAEGLTRTMTRIAELSDRYRIEAAHVYQLLDEPYWAPSFEAVMGLVALEPGTGGAWMPGAPKPAYHAVRDSVAASSTVRGCDIDATTRLDNQSHRQIAYAQCLVLGRTPEPEALEEWSARLQSGAATAVDLVASLVGSPEFDARFAPDTLDDTGFVALMYRLLLDREADGHGLQSYSAHLADGLMSRDELALAAITSGEFVARHPMLFPDVARSAGAPAVARSCALSPEASVGAPSAAEVDYAHCLVLGRNAAPSEIARWTPQLETPGTTATDLLRTLLDSPEFNGRNQAKNLTDRDYTALIYRLLLGREADGHGLDAYAAQIVNGSMTRIAVATALIRSGEFAALHPFLAETPATGVTAEPPPRTCDLEAIAGSEAPTVQRASYAHCLILGEVADAHALRLWADELEDGRISIHDLVAEFFRSDRFDDRYDPDALTDRDYVTLIYHVFLARQPDAHGLESYVARIADRSLTRDDLAIGALWSSEFAMRHAPLLE